MEEFVLIKDAKNMRSGINLKAKVKEKKEPRTVNLKRGGTTEVCDATMTDIDDTGDEINLTLWGDEIKSVNVGDIIVITNGYSSEFRGTVSISKGKYGKMEINPQ